MNNIESKVYNLHGRIMAVRLMGKACFMHIFSQGRKIQIYAKTGITTNFENFLTLRVGDIITVLQGEWFTTRSGEQTIRVLSYKLEISPIIPMPFPKSDGNQTYNEIIDKENRYRHRYIDFQVNPEVFDIFTKRSLFIRSVRNFFIDENFLEVETPILQPVYGGATAKPFTTFSNSTNHEIFLRIAPELYLKRLLIGGFEQIFEIGKNFRNEGLDRTHNPEFTMLEAYKTYANYLHMMKLFSKLLSALTLQFMDKEINYDKVYYYNELVPEKISLAEKDDYFKNHIQSTLQEPCFVINYPHELAPLAKQCETDLKYADKFQFYWKGIELVNGCSEQNDYEEQKRLFTSQINPNYLVDTDFLEALKYGMPPSGGIGIGIDRLFMAIFNINSIKETILFPQMRIKNAE